MKNLPPLYGGNNFIVTDPTLILNTTTLTNPTMNPPLASSYSDMPSESSCNYGYAFNMNNCDTWSGWIIDFGATDHMTYDPTDLACDTVHLRRNITNANDVISPVTSAGTDILTKKIIGRGTKRGDLYFVDNIATYLINRMPSKVLNFLTPLQVLATFVPLLSVLVLPPRVFGYVAFVHLHKNQRTKLDPCAICCVFMGYEIHQKGYRCYHPPSRRMYTTMDVTFSEFEMYYSSASSNPPLHGETLHDKHVWTMATTTDLSLPLAEPVAESAMATLPAQPTEAASLPTELAAGMTVPSSPTATVLSLTDLETSTNTTSSSSQNIVPADDHNPENIPEVRSTMPINVSDVSNYQLPFRHNRGKPPNRYSPETTKGSKYPIANYVSSHKLSELGKTFVQQIQ
ncbi:hypothetical protein ACFX1R_041088 [Malus domestica]